jgi:hypothetical protein
MGGKALPPEPGSAVWPGVSWPMPSSFACSPASDPVKAAVLALPTGSGKVIIEHE